MRAWILRGGMVLMGGAVFSCGGTVSEPPAAREPFAPASSLACQAQTCQSLAKNCGPVSDGCGGVLECGACGSGQRCGGGGGPNVCGYGACTPASCAEQGKDCGSVSDGCGNMVVCGTCGAGQVCGGGGIPNVCGSIQAGGTTRWTQTPGPAYRPLGLATDRFGHSVVLAADSREATSPEGNALTLTQVDEDGAVLWMKTYPHAGGALVAPHGLAVSPLGNIFVSITAQTAVDFGAGPVTGAVLLKVSPDGNLVWQRQAGDVSGAVAVDKSGSSLVFHQTAAGEPSVTKYRYDGTELWTLAAHGLQAFDFDPQGNLILALNNPSRIAKTDPDGRPIWTTPLGTAMVTSVGTSAIGTVVATGRFTRTLTFGPQSLQTSIAEGAGFLAVLEADGSARFAKLLDFSKSATPSLAVDPAGQVAIASTAAAGTCEVARVIKYNLAGQYRWTRDLATACTANGQAPVPVNVAIDTRHDVLVSGVSNGLPPTVARPEAATDSGGFLIDLAP